MKKLTGNQTRQMFLDYFKSKGHMIEPGASLIPHNDPTLLWINAGVAALKKYFDGTEKPASHRIANAQKSIRTNDIENVGKTARHHTFFEMLGNFSIGDYFKREAIHFAWEFLTGEDWIAMDKDKLYVTVYTDDEEAYRIWTEECGVDPSHMWKTADNFWEIGEGPGGPDSEIFYDRGEDFDPDHIGLRLLHEDLENDRYVEVWNIVFSQFDCNPAIDRKEYKELPHKNIDTGMGLERLVSIIQGGETNFDTDLFLPLIRETEKLANVSYEENKMAYRVIADHIRTVTFALSDGAMFDKAGRGYVLRRILRRAVRYGKAIGIEGAFLYELVDTVSDMMKEFYDYLPSKAEMVKASVKKEEEAFAKTLNQGEKRIQNFMKKHEDEKVIDGKTAFMLYDTYGFPYELTVEIAEEKGFTVDEEGFHEEMKAQQERARAARGDLESFASQKADLMDFEEPSTFNYDPSPIDGKVIALFKNGEKVEEITDEGEIIFDQTTFYAEMGGQVADKGTFANDHVKGEVVNVLKAPNGQHLHYVKVNGSVKVGDVFTLEVDTAKRVLIENNHTATHLLDAALKEILGEHVAQAGSYVDEKGLRFDFTHPSKMSEEEIKKVEELVNMKIFAGIPVEISEMKKEDALKAGATALFDEKYGDVVRVVKASDFSVELCGGCHAPNTGRIGLFKINVESSVGSGIRRIEAVTSSEAYKAMMAEKETVNAVAATLKLKNRAQIVEKVADLVDENAALRKEIEKLNGQLNALQAKSKASDVEEVNGVRFLYEHVEKNAKDAKQLVFDYKDTLGSGVIFLTSTFEDKNSYFVGVTKDLNEKGIKAGDLVKSINAVMNGRGGGKPDIAQGGAPTLDGVKEAIELIKSNL